MVIITQSGINITIYIFHRYQCSDILLVPLHTVPGWVDFQKDPSEVGLVVLVHIQDIHCVCSVHVDFGYLLGPFLVCGVLTECSSVDLKLVGLGIEGEVITWGYLDGLKQLLRVKLQEQSIEFLVSRDMCDGGRPLHHSEKVCRVACYQRQQKPPSGKQGPRSEDIVGDNQHSRYLIEEDVWSGCRARLEDSGSLRDQGAHRAISRVKVPVNTQSQHNIK